MLELYIFVLAISVVALLILLAGFVADRKKLKADVVRLTLDVSSVTNARDTYIGLTEHYQKTSVEHWKRFMQTVDERDKAERELAMSDELNVSLQARLDAKEKKKVKRGSRKIANSR